MQISALEVARLLSSEKAGLTRLKADLEFKEISPEELPASIEPDKEEVARVMEMVKDSPDIREDLVMQLKERIEKGEYTISGEEIAEMMLRRMKADSIR